MLTLTLNPEKETGFDFVQLIEEPDYYEVVFHELTEQQRMDIQVADFIKLKCYSTEFLLMVHKVEGNIHWPNFLRLEVTLENDEKVILC